MIFSDATLKALKPQAKAYRKWDGLQDPLLKGFGIHVLPSGLKAFVIRYTSSVTHKRTVMRICLYDGNLANARDMCRTFRRDIQRSICPVNAAIVLEAHGIALIEHEERAAIAAGRAEELSLEAMCRWYVTYMREKGRRSADQVETTLRKYVYPQIGQLKASGVTPYDLAPVIRDIASASQANKVRIYLSTAFKVASKAPFMTKSKIKIEIVDFGIGNNPCEPLEIDNEVSNVGDRYLERDELHVLWNSIGVDAMSPQLSIALKFLLSTGQRVEEVLESKWSEFKLDEGLWLMPERRRKASWRNRSTLEYHTVPLTPLHIELLWQAKLYSRSSEYAFPGNDSNKARSSSALNQAIKRFCNRDSALFELFTPRDCRRTFKTLTSEIGISKEIQDRLQGHSFSDVGSRHYDKHQYLKEKQEAMNSWIAWLEETIDGSYKCDDVILLRSA